MKKLRQGEVGEPLLTYLDAHCARGRASVDEYLGVWEGPSFLQRPFLLLDEWSGGVSLGAGDEGLWQHSVSSTLENGAKKDFS